MKPLKVTDTPTTPNQIQVCEIKFNENLQTKAYLFVFISIPRNLSRLTFLQKKLLTFENPRHISFLALDCSQLQSSAKL
jgi:hypothetical protein